VEGHVPFDFLHELVDVSVETVTDPNFFRYDRACALSSVPQPHSG
jgi:hypothetical protein